VQTNNSACCNQSYNDNSLSFTLLFFPSNNGYKFTLLL